MDVATERYFGYTSSEIARRGEEIYERSLREKLEPGNVGKFLVIDIETGEYEIGDDHVEVSCRAQLRFPDHARFGMRIGYAGSFRIGGALRVMG